MRHARATHLGAASAGTASTPGVERQPRLLCALLPWSRTTCHDLIMAYIFAAVKHGSQLPPVLSRGVALLIPRIAPASGDAWESDLGAWDVC